MRKWTKEEDTYLRNKFGIEPMKVLQAKLTRSKSAVYARAWKLGLSSPDGPVNRQIQTVYERRRNRAKGVIGLETIDELSQIVRYLNKPGGPPKIHQAKLERLKDLYFQCLHKGYIISDARVILSRERKKLGLNYKDLFLM